LPGSTLQFLPLSEGYTPSQRAQNQKTDRDAMIFDFA